MARVKFRRATKQDIAIYRSWFADPELLRRLSPPTPEWERYISSFGRAFWAALDRRRPIAFIQTEADGQAAWFDCAIDPARRGMGKMGTILLDFLAGPGKNFDHWLAEVEPDNRASLALLRRAGFIEMPEATPGFVRFSRSSA